MNFLVFAVVVLIAVIQGAWAITCNRCDPDYANIMREISNANSSGGLSICDKPTGTIDCSQDPNIGPMADSCYTAAITLNASLPIIGDREIKIHVLNCSVKSYCGVLKTQICGILGSTLANISMVEMKNCDVTCCEGNLCNVGSGSAATTAPNGGTNPTTKSSAKSTSMPFGILGLITVAFMNLF